jgi:hypothetical protein
VSIGQGVDDEQVDHRRNVLALPRLRRDLESVPIVVVAQDTSVRYIDRPFLESNFAFVEMTDAAQAQAVRVGGLAVWYREITVAVRSTSDAFNKGL